MKGQKGQALVEFALVVSVLLFVVLGALWFGVTFYRSHALSAAADRGAEEAAVLGGNIGGTAGPTSCAAPAGAAAVAACDELRRWLGSVADGATVTVTDAGGTPAVTVPYNELVRVRVELPVEVPVVGGRYAFTLREERARRVRRQAP